MGQSKDYTIERKRQIAIFAKTREESKPIVHIKLSYKVPKFEDLSDLEEFCKNQGESLAEILIKTLPIATLQHLVNYLVDQTEGEI